MDDVVDDRFSMDDVGRGPGREHESREMCQVKFKFYNDWISMDQRLGGARGWPDLGG